MRMTLSVAPGGGAAANVVSLPGSGIGFPDKLGALIEEGLPVTGIIAERQAVDGVARPLARMQPDDVCRQIFGGLAAVDVIGEGLREEGGSLLRRDVAPEMLHHADVATVVLIIDQDEAAMVVAIVAQRFLVVTPGIASVSRAKLVKRGPDRNLPC